MEKTILTIVIASATKIWTLKAEASFFCYDIGHKAMCNRVRKAMLASVRSVLRESRFTEYHPVEFLVGNWMEKVQLRVNRSLLDQHLSQAYLVEPTVMCRLITKGEIFPWDFRICEDEKSQLVEEEYFGT